MGIPCFWCEPLGPDPEAGAWRRADTGEVFASLADLPPGAMYDASWMAFACIKHADGRCLSVRLPDRMDWLVDRPPDGSRVAWTRTGEPPHVTARPSILTPKYHGFLTDGVLLPC